MRVHTLRRGLLLQRSVIEFVAITIGIVVCLRPAAPQLTLYMPSQRLCTSQNCVLVLISLLVAIVGFAVLIKFTEDQPWFAGSNNTSDVKVRIDYSSLPV